MNRERVAKELVAVARELTAADDLSSLYGDAAFALMNFFKAVRRDREVTPALKRQADRYIQDAVEGLDKAGDVLVDYV